MRRSAASEKNKQIGDLSDWSRRKSNSKLFEHVLSEMTEKYKVGNGGRMVIGLVGSTDYFSVMLRNAQSILRWNRQPSLWSHAFLIAEAWDGQSNINRVPILEIPMFPRSERFYRPESNGLCQTATLGDYADADVDANIALLTVIRRNPGAEGQPPTLSPLTDEDVGKLTERAKQPNFDRLRFAFWDWMREWQQYLWSEAEGRNPLREGIPIPSSAYIEMTYQALNCDLVPGAAERNSAPEHLWNAAMWWHQNTTELALGDVSPFLMSGAYAIRDPGATIQLGK